MPAPKRSLHDLNVREIAFCPDGINPAARMLLYKARDRKPVELGKEDDEPRSFGDHYESSRAMEIDEALDRRLYALLHTTTEIMRADVSDREGLILSAVEAYAETMTREVPELFAGRLAKWVNALTVEGRSSDDVVHAIVKSELELAGLIPDEPSGGVAMKFLKSLSERGAAALAFVLGDRDPAEFFKDTTDEVGKLVGGLLEKASEWAERIDTLETDLAKAKEPPVDPNSLESILKGISDPGTRAYIEGQAAQNAADREEVAKLRKSHRRGELRVIVKSVPNLPNENDALLDALEKADLAGILPTIEAILVSANAQAKLGKAFEELGIDSIIGEGSVGTPDEAHSALLAKAVELRKSEPDLSAEGAYEKACELNSDLYVASQQTTSAPH